MCICRRIHTHTRIHKLINFIIGFYIGSVYAHAYAMYNSRIWEPYDAWDIAFFLLAPVSYPVCFIASLIKER
jgi:hypothetical protein